ncbi:MAG: Type 1 glutamine amidotransferase-like domain-containing protein [Clostridia bacterium]|nr:Type 1 glutamine amidotransferase-like domain-containing protein [Clostridia bacterium]
MKLILSSCDFLNENSKKVILENIDKNIAECKVLFIPNENATQEKICSDKYYNRLYSDGFTNRKNIYIFNEFESDKYRNLDIDLIYISGGNTFATLNKLKKCGFDKDIINYIKKSVTYIGGSCGANIVTQNIEHLLSLDDNYVDIKNYDALGLFDGIIISHYGASEYNAELREKVYNDAIQFGKYKVYKLTNDDSIVVIDDKVIIYKGSDKNE